MSSAVDAPRPYMSNTYMPTCTDQRYKRVLLCRELGLEENFKDLESSSYAELIAAIEAQNVVPPAVFNLFLDKIYKRTK